MNPSPSVLARWYLQLASSLEAGLPLEQAIGAFGGPAPAAREAWQARLRAGDPVPISLERGAAWLPPIDRQLIAAGVASGRLPDVMRRLSQRHEAATKAARIAGLAALYPLAIAHFAAFAIPVRLLVAGPGAGAYALAVLQILVPVWAVLALAWVGVRRRWRAIEWLLDRLPLVGGYRRLRAVADLAFALEAQLVAGIPPDIAWLQGVAAAGDRRLEMLAVQVADRVQQGAAVSSVLAGRRELPAPFAEFYANGERTGRLDESLSFLQRQFADAARLRLTMASVAYPMLLFACVAGWIAFEIIRFYLGYFDQLEQLTH